MKRGLFLAAHPLRALLEGWLLALVVLGGLAFLVGYVVPFVFEMGMAMTCGAAGLWVVLRTRLPAAPPRCPGRAWRAWAAQGGWELQVALALSLLLLTLRLPARALGMEAAWQGGTLNTSGVTVLLLCTGPGYLLARLGLRLWLFWDRLRRRRLLWSLTNAILMLAVIVWVIGVLLLVVFNPNWRSPVLLRPGVESPAAAFAARLILNVVPSLSLFLVLMLMALAVILPPSLLFSFWFARQTTRRVEKLAQAAAALRGGDYSVRTSVQGEDEVAQLQVAFNDMAGHLQTSLRDLQAERDRVSHLLAARRELIASVSHELRTPVATARALLDAAEARAGAELSPELRRDLAVINAEMLRLQGLIDDLFTLARAETGGLALNCGPTDVAQVAGRMVAAVAGLAWNAGRVEVLADVPAGLPPAHADEIRLAQVLANLLRNAIRHTPPGGIVVAAAHAEAQEVVIEVRDTGEGIPAEELPRVWERFYRGAHSQGDGAGLGLALVKELTEAMGGRVAAESAAGQGSCFTVRLPRAAA